MLDHEIQLQIIDLTITIVLFFIGCALGKFMMIYALDSWLVFYGFAIGVIVVGGIIWRRIRKKLIKKWEED